MIDAGSAITRHRQLQIHTSDIVEGTSRRLVYAKRRKRIVLGTLKFQIRHPAHCTMFERDDPLGRTEWAIYPEVTTY